MEITHEHEIVYFNFYQMQEQIAQHGGRKFEIVEEIKEAVKSIPNFNVVGYVTPEKIKEWKVRNYAVNKTYVVSFLGNSYCYCLSCGMIV